MRLLDRGEREAGETLIRRGGAVVRGLRPDIHIQVELIILTSVDWHYGGETATLRLASEAVEEATPRGLSFAASAVSAAVDGDLDTARRRLNSLLADGLESLRRPDGHLSLTLCLLAYTAALVGDRDAGERLRPLLEPMRSRLALAVPLLSFGQLPEASIGHLELLADRPDAAAEELRDAVARADALGMVWASAWIRVDLATALRRSGDTEGAEAVLVESESLAERYGLGWASQCAAEVRAEIEGREPQALRPAAERSRPIRALASRGGRRALAAIARDLDDAQLERRFAEPRRQRALMKGLARAFQPAQAGGFSGVIAYELEPCAIEPPPDSPWRWALEVDSRTARARLVEPAPLEAAVTLHLGLADWVRVLAGLQNALAIMASGRCSVEGDVAIVARLEAMFGGR